jgi:hypothetical protein
VVQRVECKGKSQTVELDILIDQHGRFSWPFLMEDCVIIARGELKCEQRRENILQLIEVKELFGAGVAGTNQSSQSFLGKKRKKK